MPEKPASHQDVEIKPVPSRVVATWPVGHFLENLAAYPGGEFLVCVHNRKELHRVKRDGSYARWASLPAPPAGILVVDTTVHLVGGEPGQGPHALYRLDAQGKVDKIAEIPDTLFLNGFTYGPKGRGYAVDSIKGTVIELELATGRSRVVLRDERLGKISAEPMLPGANGIKSADGALYITNTDRALVLQAPLDSSGLPTGTMETVAEHLRGDDFAVAANGDLYITNHIHNTLIRLGKDGKRLAVAGPEQGMAGSTACVFGTGPDDGDSLYVTTTGGIVMPLNGVVQEAKLVRLEVGVAGRPLDFI